MTISGRCPAAAPNCWNLSPETLVREMREEIDTKCKSIDCCGWPKISLNTGRVQFHEIGFYFLMHLPADSPLRDQTDVSRA